VGEFTAFADEVHLLGDGRVLIGLLSADEHLPVLHTHESRDRRHQRGLSRAVPAEQSIDLAAGQAHREIVDGGHVAVPDGQALDVDSQGHTFSLPFIAVMRSTTSSSGMPMTRASATIGSTTSAKNRCRRCSSRAARAPGLTNMPIPLFL